MAGVPDGAGSDHGARSSTGRHRRTPRARQATHPSLRGDWTRRPGDRAVGIGTDTRSRSEGSLMMSNNYENSVRCRACDSSRRSLVLAFGHMPLANALLKESQLTEHEARFPLTVLFCHSCSLLQVLETVSPT